MALGTVLPFWPALLFTYLEPLALISGWNLAFFHASDFVNNQHPTVTSTIAPVGPGAEVLSLATANIYLLLGAVAVICTAVTKEARVAKAYIFAVALGDLGHIYSSYAVMGPEIFWDFNKYNDMMWGNIGFSLFLHVNRVLTLAGLFGRVGRKR
ncbi:hypothetical protein K504DRAFT_499505 [Pleomassaria siparia CBS 279.74]|uniref:DUF7704 domain-containing protein n=1 Tax=Pleomassaria siparia CBS 279.74 TaxID=1314801 RepID=A0A6G1KIN3_9PLEO|nr:hypothetical protein K504DRAFT_499505 [Pleomassaria siparia CBS 279.74]